MCEAYVFLGLFIQFGEFGSYAATAEQWEKGGDDDRDRGYYYKTKFTRTSARKDPSGRMDWTDKNSHQIGYGDSKWLFITASLWFACSGDRER